MERVKNNKEIIKRKFKEKLKNLKKSVELKKVQKVIRNYQQKNIKLNLSDIIIK
jgi:hypothetical protein